MGNGASKDQENHNYVSLSIENDQFNTSLSEPKGNEGNNPNSENNNTERRNKANKSRLETAGRTKCHQPFHLALVRERDPEHDFDDIYQVLDEIGRGGLCRIYCIQKYFDKIGGSSRPEGVRKKKIRAWTLFRQLPLSPNLKKRKSKSVKSQMRLMDYMDVSSGAADFGRPMTPRGTHLVGERTPHMLFALKVINLALIKEDRIDQLKNEVEILKSLDHKNIIKAYETFQIPKYKRLMIIMELCTGGNLYARMPYTERQVASVMRQVLSAVAFMHSKRIVHRDIKLENIMWESELPTAAIKLIDFGLSKRYSRQNDILTERVGTLYSMSPETMKGIYTAQADAWSLGVVAYTLLCSEKPFEGDTPKQLVANVLQCNYSFETFVSSEGGEQVNVWDKISDQAKLFIQQLLVLEPSMRITADRAKTHEWLKLCLRQRAISDSTSSSRSLATSVRDVGCFGHDDSSSHLDSLMSPTLGTFFGEENDTCDPPCISVEFKTKVIENMVRYAEMGEFRRLALNVIARKSTSAEIFDLRALFEELDTLNTGAITLQDFKKALAEFNYSDEDILHIFQKIDVNNSQVINYTEFLAAALEGQGTIEEYRLAEAFDVIDFDDTGYITRDNLKQLLGVRDKEYIDQLIAEAGFGMDGKISYNEFLQVFSRQHEDTMSKFYEEHPTTEQEQLSEASERSFNTTKLELRIAGTW